MRRGVRRFSERHVACPGGRGHSLASSVRGGGGVTSLVMFGTVHGAYRATRRSLMPPQASYFIGLTSMPAALAATDPRLEDGGPFFWDFLSLRKVAAAPVIERGSHRLARERNGRRAPCSGSAQESSRNAGSGRAGSRHRYRGPQPRARRPAEVPREPTPTVAPSPTLPRR